MAAVQLCWISSVQNLTGCIRRNVICKNNRITEINMVLRKDGGPYFFAATNTALTIQGNETGQQRPIGQKVLMKTVFSPVPDWAEDGLIFFSATLRLDKTC